ncbi:MAG: helicase-related protein [Candidatus Hermodarchaeota archaeon]
MQNQKLEYFNGPFLKKNKVFHRHYQENIVKQCKNKNTLVILPTGLGKTIIGVLLLAKSLEKYPMSKVIILAPTRPLVSQHKSSCQKFLEIEKEKITAFTGKIQPKKRISLFNDSKVIISTPQVIKNDIERGRYNLKHISLLIFDEGHRTKGNYAYNFISNEYINTCSDPLILALTASPGKDYSCIQQLCDNLFIENVIFKSYADRDVKKYIYDIDTFLEFVNVPIKVLEISAIWYNLFERYLRLFINWKLISPNKKYYSKVEFLAIARDLTLSLRYENGYEPDLSEEDYINLLYYHSPKVIDIIKEESLNIQTIYSYCSSCISLLHGKDLLETQNYSLFKSFLDRIKSKSEEDILSAKRIIHSEHYKFIEQLLENTSDEQLSHPKIEKIISIIQEEFQEYNNNKILIFTQFREMAEFLKNKITNQFKAKLKVEKFIGQTSRFNDFGFSQDKQLDILDKFRSGEINLLIATSVAEEGLDIPNVDAIIFYEPVPSEIRLIQRRGRTGRNSPGRCYILLTEGTVDIPFHKVATRKEKTMNFILSKPRNLELLENLERHEINFQKKLIYNDNINYIKNFKERGEREKDLLADHSLEDIITEIDNFAKSNEYQEFKEYGIIHFNDLIKLDKSKLKKSLLKIKGSKSNQFRKSSPRLNKNIRTLINIIKTYGQNGTLNFSKFQDLARTEEIHDDKFYIHFNQACYLGYISKQAEKVQLISDYE